MVFMLFVALYERLLGLCLVTIIFLYIFVTKILYYGKDIAN